jgi:hypothetical protein
VEKTRALSMRRVKVAVSALLATGASKNCLDVPFGIVPMDAEIGEVCPGRTSSALTPVSVSSVVIWAIMSCLSPDGVFLTTEVL